MASSSFFPAPFFDENNAALNCEIQALSLKNKQLLASVEPFAKELVHLRAKTEEYREMEASLRGRIATLEEMLSDGAADFVDAFPQCEECDAPLSSSAQAQCKRCIGDQTVCIHCCAYPNAHNHV